MASIASKLALAVSDWLSDNGDSHESVQLLHNASESALGWLDKRDWAVEGARRIRSAVSQHEEPVEVGGVRLSRRLILAAGMLKGMPYDSDSDSWDDIIRGRNIAPGWRIVPALVGPIEYGSFTNRARLGNRADSSPTIWRYGDNSLVNDVGLSNPGARSFNRFLWRHIQRVPPCFGVSFAMTLAELHSETARCDCLLSIALLCSRPKPDWITLNFSCPNVGDAAVSVKRMVEIAQRVVYEQSDIPVWVKLGPDLTRDLYTRLVRGFADVGVRAIIATNSMPRQLTTHLMHEYQNGAVSGEALRIYAQEVLGIAQEVNTRFNCGLSIIACGGVLDGETYRQCIEDYQADAVQYLTAMYLRGPLAAAAIEREYADIRS